MSMIKRAQRRMAGIVESADAEESMPVRRVRRRGASAPSTPPNPSGPAAPGPTHENHPDEEFNDSFLLEAVGSMDRKAEEIRTGSEFIHVSALIDYCARREALAFASRDAGMQVKTKPVYSGDRLIWAIGRAVEKHIREQFIASGSGGGVYGSWTCPCGSTTSTGFKPREFSVCASCGKEADAYGEYTLADFSRKIVGNPDLLYLRPDTGLFRVVEIKSINGPDFKNLTSPMLQHVLQAMSYQRLLSDIGRQSIGYGADDAVTIFYASKDYNVRPYKSFTVPVTDQWRLRIEDLWESAEARYDWIRGRRSGIAQGFPPRIQRCPAITSTMAKSCPECVGCFSNP